MEKEIVKMKDEIKGFVFNIFRFYLEFDNDEVDLPFLYIHFRGAFGFYLKKLFCVAHRESSCSSCILNQKCVYGYLFETIPPEDRYLMRLYKTIPHPFTFSFEDLPNNNIQLNLLLIGKAVEFLPHILMTIRSMGELGLSSKKLHFMIKSVSDLLDIKVFSEHDEIIRNPNEYYGISNVFEKDLESEEITVDLITPLRLQSNGRILKKLDFASFLVSILRRYKNLAYFHCGFDPEIDFKGLKQKAETIQILENNTFFRPRRRYSRRQDNSYDNGGILGSFTIGGKYLKDLLLYIKVGSYIHTGKATSFGNGKYLIKGFK